MEFTIYQGSRPGGRKVNQDRIAHSYTRNSLIMVVTDGMGGHTNGEIAAQIAARIIIERFQKQADVTIKDPQFFLEDTIMRAHSAITEYANEFSMLETPRTTCVICLIQDDLAYWAHVGDSRLYFFRGLKLLAQTRDHSKIQHLLDQGLINESEIASHPERNKIYSCLGGESAPQITLSRKTPVLPGDIILLSSDGLWGMFSPDEIASILVAAPLMEAVPKLMDFAELRAGNEGDNLSAVAVSWGKEDTNRPLVSTITMPLGDYQTHIDQIDLSRQGNEMSEEDIEIAIAEIQSAIKKYSK
jgi:serine/threonine protein phosphatase PrpC